jgi:hypothetical protein
MLLPRATRVTLSFVLVRARMEELHTSIRSDRKSLILGRNALATHPL